MRKKNTQTNKFSLLTEPPTRGLGFPFRHPVALPHNSPIIWPWHSHKCVWLQNPSPQHCHLRQTSLAPNFTPYHGLFDEFSKSPFFRMRLTEHFFYAKHYNRIDLSSATRTEAELRHLEKACDPPLTSSIVVSQDREM